MILNEEIGHQAMVNEGEKGKCENGERNNYSGWWRKVTGWPGSTSCFSHKWSDLRAKHLLSASPVSYAFSVIFSCPLPFLKH